MPKKEKKFKRVFSVDGFSTCCNRVTYTYEQWQKNWYDREKPSVLDMNLRMRFKSGALGKWDTFCGECGKLTPSLNTKSSKYPRTMTDFMTLKMFPEYDHKIRMTAGRSHYRWIKERGVTLRQDKIWNVFNPKTGWMFHCLKKEGQKKIVVRNHTYTGTLTGPFHAKMKSEFVERCLDARTFYTWPIDMRQELAMHPQKPLEDTTAETWEYIFTCLRFPALTTLPMANWGPPPRKWRKFLTTEMRRTQVIKKIFNNPTKKIVELIYGDNVRLSDLQLACHVFKRDYVEQLIDVGTFRGKNFAGTDFGWRETILNETDVSKAIPRFVKEYGEKRLINQMIKAYDAADLDAMSMQIGMGNDLHYLGDTVRMWVEIKEAIPDYEMPRDRTVKAVHDKISKDHRRLQTDDLVIPYSEGEWAMHGNHNDEVVFTLPLRTHDLTYAGEVMDICVGSYGNGAAKKDYTIVLVNAADDGRLLACLQINGNRLTQAKGVHNWHLPFLTGEYIIDWCEKHNIKYQGCGDLTLAMRNTQTGLDAVAAQGREFEVPEVNIAELMPAVAVPNNRAPAVVDVRGFDFVEEAAVAADNNQPFNQEVLHE